MNKQTDSVKTNNLKQRFLQPSRASRCRDMALHHAMQVSPISFKDVHYDDFLLDMHVEHADDTQR